LISFSNCTVTYRDQILFHPSWGRYDMSVGEAIVSAFSGIADPNSFGLTFEVPKEKTHKIQYSENEKKLFLHYKKVANIRRSGNIDLEVLTDVFSKLKSEHPEDWLLVLEIYELIAADKTSHLTREVKTYLNKVSENEPFKHLIKDGIQLLKT